MLATQLFRTPTYLVPELTAMPEAEARNMIAPNDWEISVERERSDEVPVVGQVVRTAPAAGVELAEGEPFLIVVSDGPVLRELPESTGRPASEAQTDLVSRQLAVDVVEANDEVVPPGTVISWAVPGDATLVAGSLVEPETVVQLVVSTGPAPRTVPNLIGRASGDAQGEIESLGLVFTVTETVFNDEAPLGAIISQSIAEGTQVGRGSRSRSWSRPAPTWSTFPDISGQPNFDARRRSSCATPVSNRCSPSVTARGRSRASRSTATRPRSAAPIAAARSSSSPPCEAVNARSSSAPGVGYGAAL